MPGNKSLLRLYYHLIKISIMKKILPVLALCFCIGCNRQQKDFATVKVGMTKQDVIKAVGEPPKKSDVGIEFWTYPEADRTVVFRSDTVYGIITSAKARMDSIKNALEKAGQKVENGLQKMGKEIDSSASNVKKKLDTAKSKKK
jgi:hypothetical protein